MYRPTHENGYWRINLNQEIYNQFQSQDILTVSTVCGLGWLVHVIRMDGEKTLRYCKANQEEDIKKEDLD